ncbi:ABC transporter ATP-binding protein [Clostridium aminobutyricum]|uniref:ABC transporter ATP-binding protein n=1 Tax=Clostridium aminobutyricum TaxID=33953 RepID=A0A939D6V6_CLOAM|nr:ABC transporter ATP-binding protein [Clostridium aminobutyricum]MBN7771828.1 ABC transporter ATP-binding protein [Clostridium aminobutyricum]
MKLRVIDTSCSFQGNAVLEKMNMEVEEGQFVSILGPSGCGKSTLLNFIAGLIQADCGQVLVDGRPVEGISEHFAYMPQQDLLLPWKNIMDNVCLYGRIHGNIKPMRQQAEKIFERFGLAGYEKKYPFQLSGGMRQRAAFLRTALCKADILLLDEPFAALDVITRGDMQDWLLSIREELNRTMVLVTHDIDEAIYLSDKIVVLSGKPASVQRELVIMEKHRTKEWLFAQKEIREEIYHLLKNQSNNLEGS